MAAACDFEGIRQQFSPPDAKEYNGSVESYIGHIGRKVTSMMACAPHVKEHMWGYAWDLAENLDLLRPSPIPGQGHRTRYFSFYKSVPDLNEMIVLPFGQPVEYRVPLDQRPGKFSSRSYTGIYMKYSMSIPGGILVYSYTTKAFVDTNSFVVLSEVPSPWVVYPREFFAATSEGMESGPLDVQAPGTRTRGRAIREERAIAARNDQSSTLPNVAGLLPEGAPGEVSLPEGATGPVLTQVGAPGIPLQEGVVDAALPLEEAVGAVLPSEGAAGAALPPEGAVGAALPPESGASAAGCGRRCVASRGCCASFVDKFCATRPTFSSTSDSLPLKCSSGFCTRIS